MKVFGILIQICLCFLPWRLRKYFLNVLFGFKIGSNCKVGFSLLMCDELLMSNNTKIGHLTICKNIDRLVLKQNSSIGSLNFITGFNTKKTNFFSHNSSRKCELILGRHSAITSRHYLDCNGGIYVGCFSTIAGIKSTFLTHSIDLYDNRQDIKPIIIGDYCFLGTGVIVLGGAGLPDYSVLGAGAVLTNSFQQKYYLYGGVPAKPIKKLDRENVKYFSRLIGYVK